MQPRIAEIDYVVELLKSLRLALNIPLFSMRKHIALSRNSIAGMPRNGHGLGARPGEAFGRETKFDPRGFLDSLLACTEYVVVRLDE